MEFEQVIPEPDWWYSPPDEAMFFKALESLSEVSSVTSRRGPNREPLLVLHLTTRFLSEESLVTLLGLLQRYGLSMSRLKEQCGPHNEHWFRHENGYWYKSVFGED